MRLFLTITTGYFLIHGYLAIFGIKPQAYHFIGVGVLIGYLCGRLIRRS
ncbi:hypothetical protein LCGC14_2378530, partial [marine sediment metagenome]